MHKTFLFALVCLLLPVASSFAGKQDFKLVNKTSFDVHEVYVSPHSSEDWEEDVLGQGILEVGKSVDITFDRSDKTKDWDLKVVDGAGKSIVWEKLNLLEISKVTIHYTKGKAEADVE